MNPTSSIPNELQLRYADEQITALYDVLDELHNAASEGDLQQMTTINEGELVGLLRDLIYTAQETIREIETRRNKRERRGVSKKEVLSIEPLLRMMQPEASSEGRQA